MKRIKEIREGGVFTGGFSVGVELRNYGPFSLIGVVIFALRVFT
jgi:hypothetical protein